MPSSLSASAPLHDPSTSWILTHSGRQIWPLDPHPADIDVRDIAHALSLQCRYNGHCAGFYSVAQHSDLCSRYCEAQGASLELQLAALLHDASEAYLPDVTRPVKAHLYIHNPAAGIYEPFREAEARILRAVAEHLHLDPAHFQDPLIKEADAVLLMTERRDLMPPCPTGDWGTKVPRLLTQPILPMDPREAEEEWTVHYRALRTCLRNAAARHPAAA